MLNTPTAQGEKMKRYTLNERGRTIFIEAPFVILCALLAGTNLVEVIVRWMIGL